MTGPSSTAALARLGFADPGRVQRLLGRDGLRLWDPDAGAPIDASARAVVGALARSANPDLAALALGRLVDAGGEQMRTALLRRVATDERLCARLTGVLGASAALGDHLAAHPGDWHLLEPADSPADPAERGAPTGTPNNGDSAGGAGSADNASRERRAALVREQLLTSVQADPCSAGPVATGADPVTGLRLAYRRQLLSLAARDVTGESTLAEVTGELSDLAAATLDAALAIARAETDPAAPPCRLAVIAMGKCGGRELNYVSDVDVVFVAEPRHDPASNGAGGPGDRTDTAALRTATAQATRMMAICAAVAWPVDAGLRPEGRDGPLVRTLASHEAYYRRWARTWEFQALLKARPVAGDPELGAAYVDRLAPLVWRAADREHFVEEVQAMRRRVEETLPPTGRDLELKLGPGGLRDVEFAVQLLQLVHGRADDSLHSGTTLDALAALAAGGYVGRADAATLAESYTFLRTVEHRLQLQRLRRVHRIPTDRDGLRWLAASLGYRSEAAVDAVEAFNADHGRHAREVRRLHEKLFYRPLLQSVARVPTDELRLTPDAARDRLEVLGFADPAGAMRHLQALTAGVSRKAAIQRALLPAMLHAFAGSADPDAGLLSYRQVSEALGSTPWYLRFLRDEGLVAERLATLLGSSRYVADLLGRAPETFRMLAYDDELRPRPAETVRQAMLAAAGRSDNWEDAVVTARGLRRQELLRIACADLLGLLDISAVGDALAAVADAVLAAALETASREAGRPAVRVAVIAMGRLGGREVGYGSDADVLFVCEPTPGRAATGDPVREARAVVEEMRRLLAIPAPDPPLSVDADLRPEGRKGPLVRTLDSYAAYYARWASVWEAQALLRARFVAGDEDLGRRFEALADRYRYPRGGLTTAQVTEIRRIKARVDSERLPRGADPATHTKLGRGGLGDVEWTVQLLQLQHAGALPGLRTTRTLEALIAAVGAGLLGSEDAAALAAAWTLATQVRNAVLLVRGRPSDELPRRPRELLAVARAVEHRSRADPGEFVDAYLRTARRARQVVERIFYG